MSPGTSGQMGVSLVSQPSRMGWGHSMGPGWLWTSSGLGRWGGGQSLGTSPLPTDYFSEHLGVYRPVLAALESLNRAVLTAMDATKLVSES